MSILSHDMVWGSLIHLGRNGWDESSSADHVRFDENLWGEVSAELRAKGSNTIVLSLGEAIVYPSHPELAVRGSWCPDKLRAELARLREMGFEVLPKLNFSTTHDLWLGEYGRMVSTRKYYDVCADVIRDVVELFGTPRLFHLGFDEEIELYQRTYDLCVLRQGELWWHDFLWFVNEVEKQGVRAWAWSGEKHNPEEFRRRMPKSVLQSPWLYMGFKDPKYVKDVIPYDQLAEWGYDILPCGSNCYGVYTNFEQNVRHCKEHYPHGQIKGFIHAPWLEMSEGEGTTIYYEKRFDRKTRFLRSASEIGDGIAVWNDKGIRKG